MMYHFTKMLANNESEQVQSRHSLCSPETEIRSTVSVSPKLFHIAASVTSNISLAI